jgi:hypothetical protein
MQTPLNAIAVVDTSGWPKYESSKRQVRQRYDSHFNGTEMRDFLIYSWLFKLIKNMSVYNHEILLRFYNEKHFLHTDPLLCSNTELSYSEFSGF